MKTNSVLPLLLFGAAGYASIAVAQLPGTFTPMVGMKMPRTGHTATLLSNGKVLIAGGIADPFGGPIATAEIYDPDRGFLPTGDMTAPRSHHTATLLPDGRVLLAGGDISAGGGLIPSNRADIYDPSTGTFAATGNMIRNHACHEANLLRNGKILIVGSYGGVTNAELYDPATGAFALTGQYTRIADLNVCQGAASSLLTDGRVLIIWQDSGAEIYDPGTGSFTPTGEPIQGGNNNGMPVATLLMNGRVLIAGGMSDGSYGPRAGLYDLSTGTFTGTGSTAIGRAFHTASLLPDGSVFLAGTIRWGDAPLADTELYDPVAGAFAPLAAMTTPSFAHTATLLNNGKLLIAGGVAFDGPTSRAELYSPTILVPAPRLFSPWHASTGEIASPASPAAIGEVLSMYTSSLSEGGLIPPRVAVGGRLAEILYFGSAPGYPGYYQVNFRLPGGIGAGPEVPVWLTYIGRHSNEVTIGVR